MNELFGLKNKSDSKGILGGITGSIGWALVAIILSRVLGFDISKKDDLMPLAENAEVIGAQISVIVALFGAAVGLWGNWVRRFKVAFSSGYKNPLKARGIWGNLLAVGAGIWAFIQAVELDSDQLIQLLGEAEDQWMIVAPAVMGILGTIQGLWGRWRAQEPVSSFAWDGDYNTSHLPVLGFLLIGSLFLLSSCSTVDPKFNPEFGSEVTPDNQICLKATVMGFGPRVCLGLTTPSQKSEY